MGTTFNIYNHELMGSHTNHERLQFSGKCVWRDEKYHGQRARPVVYHRHDDSERNGHEGRADIYLCFNSTGKGCELNAKDRDYSLF